MSSSSAVDVEVRLKLKDGATTGIKSVSQTAQQEAAKTATATEKAAQKAAEAVDKGAARQRSSYEKLSHARETLGMRSERAIQREIQQTEAAYNRLKASGTLSWQQQAAAADKMRQKVTQLTNEMGKLTSAQKAYAGVKFGAAGLAGVGAAGYTLKAPAMAAMSFDERLAHMANTAFNERDSAGRKIGMKELESAVNKAVGKGGGGTREQAAEALDSLIASGAMSSSGAIDMLPQLMRYSAASGADPAQLAQIGIRAKQTFKISDSDFPNVMNMAIAAGQSGGFELKDMAKWLPQQMAAATMSGMSGRAGFAKLAALNQAAAITAGSKDEAGNNVVNLLAKINSDDAADKAKKLGIDLPKYLQNRRAKGVDSVDAFAELVDKTVASRSDYKSLQVKLKSSKTDDEKRATLESMAAIAQGAGIGQLIVDRQAMMALLGMMNNPEYLKKVLGDVRANDVSSGGAGDKNYEVVSDTSAFKLRQAEQQKDIGQKSAMDSLTPAIGKAADAFADLASKHPLLIGTTTLATTALGALAGAAGLASLAMGGKGLPGGGAISKAAASRAGQTVMSVGKVGGIASVSAMVGDYALGKAFGADSSISRYGSSALNGAALGATLGSVVPVLGTGIGAAVGGGLGLALQGLIDLQRSLRPVEQQPLDVNAKLQVGLAPGLVLQSQSMQASGGNVQMNTGNLYTGAP